MNSDWAKELPYPVTICDREGVVVYLNDASAKMFSKSGGRTLLGRNLLDCHPELARTKVAELLKTGRSNAYTIEKKGEKKFIHQSPWYENGVYAGLVEIVLPLPADLPHFIRK